MYEHDELEAVAFEGVRDLWYLRMLREVQDTTLKYKDWIVDEGTLYRYREDPLLDPIVSHEEKLKLVLPVELRERVMSDEHCAPSSEHLGVEKTYDHIAREYYWKGVYLLRRKEFRVSVRAVPEVQGGADGSSGTDGQ